MSDTKPTLLRLRQSTVDKLKAVLAHSAHRSMASLADEILDKELSKQLDIHDDDITRMVKAVRHGQQS